jgi:hypothetical protein
MLVLADCLGEFVKMICCAIWARVFSWRITLDNLLRDLGEGFFRENWFGDFVRKNMLGENQRGGFSGNEASKSSWRFAKESEAGD